MYVEYYIDAEGSSCIGSTNRWYPRHPGSQPIAYHIGCTSCGCVFANVVPLGDHDSRHMFLAGTCTSCFERGRRSLLGIYTIPGSSLPCVESHNEQAFLDVLSLELLKREFLIRYALYQRTGGFAGARFAA